MKGETIKLIDYRDGSAAVEYLCRACGKIHERHWAAGGDMELIDTRAPGYVAPNPAEDRYPPEPMERCHCLPPVNQE